MPASSTLTTPASRPILEAFSLRHPQRCAKDRPTSPCCTTETSRTSWSCARRCSRRPRPFLTSLLRERRVQRTFAGRWFLPLLVGHRFSTLQTPSPVWRLALGGEFLRCSTAPSRNSGGSGTPTLIKWKFYEKYLYRYRPVFGSGFAQRARASITRASARGFGEKVLAEQLP